MNPAIRHAVVLTALLSVAPPASAQAPGPASTLLENAKKVAQNLVQTDYVHEKEAAAASVKESGGKYEIETDCSGWVSYNLMNAGLTTPWYKAIRSYQPNIPSEKGAPYPRANVYQGYLASLSTQPGTAPFVQVPSLPAIQPGDILAWCLGSHCQKPTTQQQADDTGHVMIVISSPIKNDSTSSFLMVLDSSSVTHWSFDSLPAAVKQANPGLGKQYAQFPQVRIQAGNHKTSGVGAGFILFQTDPSGAITGFQFEQNGSMHAAAQQGIQFAAGRLVPSASK